MRYSGPFFLMLVLLFTIGVSKQNGASFKKHLKYEPGIVVVKLKAHAGRLQKTDAAGVFALLKTKYDAAFPERAFQISTKKKMKGAEELERIYTLKVPSPTDIEALARKIVREPSVEYAEPNYYFPVHTIPNDPLYSQIAQLAVVKADTAWGIQKGDPDVIIGVIDTGVDWDHPDLASVIWNNADEIPGNGIDDDQNGYIDDVRGWDFVHNVTDVYANEDSTTEDNNPMDFNGHGTIVSGIAAGATNNGTGIASLAWGCRIMPLRVGWHSSGGEGLISSLFASKAYQYAADNGASVCNQSSGTSEAVIDGAWYAFKNGVVITNAAGNDNNEGVSVLGAQPWALSVAATENDDVKAFFSSYGEAVDISAPGVSFLSTVVFPSEFYLGKQYDSFNGTSFSSPFVAALAALIKSQHKTWTPAQVMFQLTGTADNVDAKNPEYAGKLGFGRMNALRAVTETPPAPKPNLNYVGYTVNDASGGNGNGILEAGENAQLGFIIRNDWGDAQNLTAQLSTANSGVTITKTTSSYGLLRGISVIDSSQHGSLNDDFAITVSSSAQPQIISFAVSLTAAGGYTKQFSVEIPLSPQVLLVDDDDGIVNVESYFKDALNVLNVVYEQWDHTVQKTPPLSLLQRYKAVVWLCEWAFPALDSSDRALLTAYLDGGGRFFLSGQDIGWDLADLSGTEYIASSGASKVFFENYLRSKYISDDTDDDILNGVADDPIGNGLAIQRYQPFRDFDNQYPDVIDPVNGSTAIFNYPAGTHAGAIQYNGAYKLVYFAFGGFESITDSVKRLTIMNKVLGWLDNTITTAGIDEKQGIPASFHLSQNYPNPFNPATTITYSIPKESHVTLTVFDILGREAEVLVNETKQPGRHQINFNASCLASGIYFYKLSAQGYVDIKKMMLVK